MYVYSENISSEYFKISIEKLSMITIKQMNKYRYDQEIKPDD